MKQADKRLFANHALGYTLALLLITGLFYELV